MVVVRGENQEEEAAVVVLVVCGVGWSAGLLPDISDWIMSRNFCISSSAASDLAGGGVADAGDCEGAAGLAPDGVGSAGAGFCHNQPILTVSVWNTGKESEELL